MNRSQRMEPVVRVAGRREEDAARDLAKQRDLLAHQERQLAELQSYRSEYLERLHDQSGSGVNASRLQDYRIFLDKLDTAIGQQERIVAQQRREVERFHQRWLALRSRCNAMDKAVERMRNEERRALDRREQMESDENAGQRHRSNK